VPWIGNGWQQMGQAWCGAMRSGGLANKEALLPSNPITKAFQFAEYSPANARTRS